jgi:UDP-N-acetyl-D-glucosamine dehydrogenase
MSYDLVVLGLGYVGMPLAREAAEAGLKVIGFDTDALVVETLNSGKSPVDTVSDEDVFKLAARGFRATSVVDEIRGAKVAAICVPTPLSPDGGPDLRSVLAATQTVAQLLERGMLVVLESTTYPGTTEEVIKPILEAAVPGGEFDLAFSPERIDPSNPVYGLKNTPKIVGGLTPRATKRAAEFYGQFIDTVVTAKGAREAETAKLLENTYRHINIALVNEMARFCHALDIDVWDVIELAKSKPFGFQAFYPGPGVGGHCIPIDPHYLNHRARTRLGYPFRFVELAEEVNATMPAYVASRVRDLLDAEGVPPRSASVLILGVTYKPDIADQRESPAVPLAHELLKLGLDLSFHDPNVEAWRVGEQTFTRILDVERTVEEVDLVLLVQNHSAYDPDALAARAKCFFDTRGVTTLDSAHRL